MDEAMKQLLAKIKSRLKLIIQKRQYKSLSKPLKHFFKSANKIEEKDYQLFEPEYYLEENPDIAQNNIDPLTHFIEYGAAQGRKFMRPETALAIQQPFIADPNYAMVYLQQSQFPTLFSERLPPKAKIGLYTSSQGNYFFDEMRDLLEQALTIIGFTPVILDENSPRPADLAVDLFIAPHEFFILGNTLKLLRNFKKLNAYILVAEQWHTPWFARSLLGLVGAKNIFDINLQSAAGLRKLGLPAHFLPLGYVPEFAPFAFQPELPDSLALKSLSNSVKEYKPLEEEQFGDRPLDILFIGKSNTRREQFFARHADLFSRYHCFFHIPQADIPPLQNSNAALNRTAVIGLAQRSKILLNIHKYDTPYFEWHRIVFHGFWQKTLVVSEPCFRVPGFNPGEHYIEADLETMPQVIDWLLTTSEGMAAAEVMRLKAFETLQQDFNLPEILRQLL